jgi:hypothetical protein
MGDAEAVSMPDGLDEKGMPKEKPVGGMHPFMFYTVWELGKAALGVLAALAIHAIGQDTHDEKVAVLKANDLGFLYLAFFVFSLKDSVQQAFVSIGRKATGCNNPDQYVYEVVGKPQLPYVRLVQDGPVGEFNRAMRGIDNTRESFPTIAASCLLAGYVYPHAVLVVAVLWTLARGWYSKGYIGKTAGRVPGHFCSYFCGTVVPNGMVLFAGVKSFV